MNSHRFSAEHAFGRACFGSTRLLWLPLTNQRIPGDVWVKSGLALQWEGQFSQDGVTGPADGIASLACLDQGLAEWRHNSSYHINLGISGPQVWSTIPKKNCEHICIHLQLRGLREALLVLVGRKARLAEDSSWCLRKEGRKENRWKLNKKVLKWSLEKWTFGTPDAEKITGSLKSTFMDCVCLTGTVQSYNINEWCVLFLSKIHICRYGEEKKYKKYIN